MLQLLKDEKEIGCHQIFGNGDYFKDFHACKKGGRIFNPKLESGYELKVSYY